MLICVPQKLKIISLKKYTSHPRVPERVAAVFD